MIISELETIELVTYVYGHPELINVVPYAMLIFVIIVVSIKLIRFVFCTEVLGNRKEVTFYENEKNIRIEAHNIKEIFQDIATLILIFISPIIILNFYPDENFWLVFITINIILNLIVMLIFELILKPFIELLLVLCYTKNG